MIDIDIPLHIDDRTPLKAFAVHRLKISCPICHHKDGCLVIPAKYNDKNIIVVNSRVYCIRTASDKPTTALGAWIHPRPGVVDCVIPAKNTEQRQDRVLAELATPEKRDRVYRALLKQYPLNKDDLAYLEGRGITDPSEQALFGSFKRGKKSPPWSAWHGIDPEGVPGFYKHGGQWQNRVLNGILFPIVSNGLIVGLQIRRNTKDGKYIWYSTGDDDKYVLGAAAAPTPHDSFTPGNKEYKRLWITEGYFKSKAITKDCGDLALSIQGVSQWQGALNRARAIGAKELVLAFDADSESNKHVMGALQSFMNAADDFDIYMARWDSGKYKSDAFGGYSYKWKGIDDALEAGRRPSLDRVRVSKYISLKAGQKKIHDLCYNMLLNPKPGFQLIQGTVGASKTTGTIKALNRLKMSGKWPMVPGKRKRQKIAFLVDTKANVQEVSEMLNFEHGLLMGRDDDPSSKFYCERVFDCAQAGQANHNVYKSVCQACPAIEECENLKYLWSVRQAMKKDFIIATKAAFFNNSKRFDQVDIVICDENIHQHLFTIEQITQGTFETYRETLNHLGDAPDSPRRLQFERLQSIIDDAGQFIEPAGDLSFIDDGLGLDGKPWQNKNGYTVYPRDFMSNLSDRPCIPAIQRDVLHLCRPQFRHIENLKDKLVINLDATPIMDLLTPLNPVVHEINVKQYMKIYQIQKQKGSKKELAQKSYADRFVAAVRKLTETAKKVAVFGPKSFIYGPVADAGIKADLGNYGNDTKATNRYKNHDRIVMVGDFMINLGILKLLTKTLFQFWNVETDAKRLVKQTRLAEFKQGLGRGRGTLRSEENPLEVWILTNVPMPELQITQTVRGLENIYQDQPQADQEVIQKATKKQVHSEANNIYNSMSEGDKKRIRKDSPALKMEAYYAKNTSPQIKLQRGSSEVLPYGHNVFSNIYSTLDLSTWENCWKTATRFDLAGWRPEGVQERKWKQFLTTLERPDLPNNTQRAKFAGLNIKTLVNYAKAAFEWLTLTQYWTSLINQGIEELQSIGDEEWITVHFENIARAGLLPFELKSELGSVSSRWLAASLVYDDREAARDLEKDYRNKLASVPYKYRPKVEETA